MKYMKDRYINLGGGSIPETDGAEVKFSLDSQAVQLGGKHWKWIWNRPRGITLSKGGQRRHVPIIDVTRWLEAILYGISVVLVAVGMIRKLASKEGELNGA